MALVFAGFTAATALGAPFGTYLGLVVGWRLTFAAVAAPAIISVVFVAGLLPRRMDAAPVDRRVFAQALRQPLLMATLVVTLVQMAAQLSVFTYIAPYVQDRVQNGAVGITLLFLANGTAGFVGNLGGGGYCSLGLRRSRVQCAAAGPPRRSLPRACQRRSRVECVVSVSGDLARIFPWRSRGRCRSDTQPALARRRPLCLITGRLTAAGCIIDCASTMLRVC
ncbi:MAG: hypothetical protein GVY23_07425 [Spirochaetes bacterium]|nr:hypothetical protein [Spirochaetota bacterium]